MFTLGQSNLPCTSKIVQHKVSGNGLIATLMCFLEMMEQHREWFWGRQHAPWFLTAHSYLVLMQWSHIAHAISSSGTGQLLCVEDLCQKYFWCKSEKPSVRFQELEKWLGYGRFDSSADPASFQAWSTNYSGFSALFYPLPASVLPSSQPLHCSALYLERW